MLSADKINCTYFFKQIEIGRDNNVCPIISGIATTNASKKDKYPKANSNSVQHGSVFKALCHINFIVPGAIIQFCLLLI